MPLSRSWESSSSRDSRSSTVPGPITFTVPGLKIPEGISLSLKVPRSLMTV